LQSAYYLLPLEHKKGLIMLSELGESAFWWCTGLTSITVSHDNPVYKSENGKLTKKSNLCKELFLPKKSP